MIGNKCVWFSLSSASFIFITIKMNKNKTAIAPTYITKKEIGKNSKLNKNRILETLQKHNIKNNIENIGFFEKIINIADKIEMLEKNINKK